MIKFSNPSFKRWTLMALATVGGLAAVVGVAWALSFSISGIFKYNASGGSLAPYLIGYYDTTTNDCIGVACSTNIRNVEAVLYLVNPTPLDLIAHIAIFDDDEVRLICARRDLSPNKVQRINLVDDFVGLDNQLGVIKIMTVDANSTAIKVQPGIKAWLVHHREQVVHAQNPTNAVFSHESTLQEVPIEVLAKKIGGVAFELEQILCPAT